jgi:tetratricopeptide (TPR) repeat protein
MRNRTAILTTLFTALVIALPVSVATAGPTTCPLSGVRGKAVETLAPAEKTALISELDCALASNYTDLEAREDRLETALSAGQYGTAASDASTLRKLDPARFDALAQNVSLNASTNPGNPQVLALAGLLHWAAARDDLALMDYQAILAVQPNSVFALLFRGSSYLYLGDDIHALADFQQAVNLDPNNPHVYSIIGSTHQQVGSVMDALMALDYAIRLNPADARSHYFRGMALLDNQDLNGAHSEFTLAVQYDPTYADAWYDRARVDVMLSANANALADLDQALAIHPEFDLALVFRGALHEWAGDSAQATSDFFAYTSALDADVMNAGALSLNAPQTVNLDTRILYTFTFEGSAGDLVQLAAQSAQDQVDPVLVLLGPDGQTPVAGSDDASPTASDALIHNVALPASGMYTVLVTHSDNNTTGPVVVTLSAP